MEAGQDENTILTPTPANPHPPRLQISDSKGNDLGQAAVPIALGFPVDGPHVQLPPDNPAAAHAATTASRGVFPPVKERVRVALSSGGVFKYVNTIEYVGLMVAWNGVQVQPTHVGPLLSLATPKHPTNQNHRGTLVLDLSIVITQLPHAFLRRHRRGAAAPSSDTTAQGQQLLTSPSPPPPYALGRVASR